jgi:hypothetical protein
MAGIKTGVDGQINNNIQTLGLVGYWDAAYNKSFTPGTTKTYNLASGSLTPTGSLFNDIAYDSSGGGSWTLDGTDDYINLENNLSSEGLSTNNWSIDFWFNTNDVTSGQYHYIFTNGFPVQITTHGALLKCWLSTNAGAGAYYVNGQTAGVTLSTDTWYNATLVKNGTDSHAWYINGAATITNTGNGTSPTSTNTTTFIGVWITEAYDFNGEISNDKVYNTSLTAGDVLQNYNAQKDRFGL